MSWYYNLPIPDHLEPLKLTGQKILVAKELGLEDVVRNPPYEEEMLGHQFKFNYLDHFFPLLVENCVAGYIKKYEITQDDRILDIGTYPGEFAIYAAKEGAEVVCVEPDESNASVTRKNLELNNVESKIITKVVSDKEGVENFEISDSIDSRISEESNLEKESTTLNKLHEEYGPFDFVKMDIEGAELKAMQRSDKMIENGTTFAIASYHKVGGQKTSNMIESFFRDKGYKTSTEFEQHLTTFGWKPDN